VNFTETAGDLRTTSVDLVGVDGTRRTVSARKEIIVTGGAYCTPPILMRSGIGPRAELEKHDIECLVDSPGVGQNLVDHLVVMAFYETEKKGLTNDAKVYRGDAFASTYAQWQSEKTGFLATVCCLYEESAKPTFTAILKHCSSPSVPSLTLVSMIASKMSRSTRKPKPVPRLVVIPCT
jgi:hypothetical protein